MKGKEKLIDGFVPVTGRRQRQSSSRLWYCWWISQVRDAQYVSCSAVCGTELAYPAMRCPVCCFAARGTERACTAMLYLVLHAATWHLGVVVSGSVMGQGRG
eukprot:843517-Rhodomonas_salina.1